MEGTGLGACDKVKRAGGRRVKGPAMGEGSAATNWGKTPRAWRATQRVCGCGMKFKLT